MSRRATAPPSTAPKYEVPTGNPSTWSIRQLMGFLQQVPGCDIEGIIYKKELVDLAIQYLPATNEDDNEDTGAAAASSSPSSTTTTIPSDFSQRTPSQWITAKFKSDDPASEKAVQYLRTSQKKGADAASKMMLEAVFEEHIFRGPPITMNQLPPSVGFSLAVSSYAGKSVIALLTSDAGCGGVCGKSVTQADTVYRCLQCSADPTCIMCSECFFRSPCVNHPYKMSAAGGGMCDCGDPSAWEETSFCSKHKVPQDGDAAPPTLTEMLSPEDAIWVPAVLRGTAGVIARILYSMVEIQKTVKEVGDGLIAGVASSLIGSLLQCASVSPAGRGAVYQAMIHRWRDTSSSSSSTPTLVLMDELVRFDMNRIFKRVSQQEHNLHSLFRIVIVEPESKLDVIRSLMRFMERKSPKSRKDRMNSVDQEAVQVLTVPWAVSKAMDPEELRLGEGNTVLHRLLSGMLYGLSKSCTGDPFPEAMKDDTHVGTEEYPVLRVKEAEGVFDEMRTLLYNMKYTINSSRDVAGRMMVLSRVLLNALCIAIEPAHFLGWIRRADDAVDKYAFETADLCFAVSHTIQPELGFLWGNIFPLLPAGGPMLLPPHINVDDEGIVGGMSSAPPTTALLAEKFLEVLRQSKTFPLPPDEVTSWNFKNILERCGKWQLAVGPDSLLPVPSKAELESPVHPISSRLELAWATAGQLLQSLAIVAYAQSTYGDSTIAPFHPLTRHVHGSEGVVVPITSRCILRGASYSYSQPLFRLLGVLIHRFLAADLKDPTVVVAQGGAAATASSPLLLPHRRLRTILPDTTYLVGDGGQQQQPASVTLHHMLDLLLMSKVASSQMHNQLWRRDYFSCLRQQDVYDGMQTSRIKEMDHLMLQCLTACLDPWDVSAQMLERFSYLPALGKAPSSATSDGGSTSSRRNKKSAKSDSFYSVHEVPMGYGRYLTLILGLVGDAVQSCANRKESVLLRMLSIMAPKPPMLTSQLMEALGKTEEDSSSARQGDALDRENEIDAIIKEVSTSQRSKKGTTRRIKKEKELWAKIPPYSVCWDLNDRHAAIESYTMAFPAPISATTANSSSSSSSSKQAYPYTVSEFPCPAVAPHHPALGSSLRALLHSPMSVSTALFIVLQHAAQCRSNVVPQSVYEAANNAQANEEAVGFASSGKKYTTDVTGHAPEIFTALKVAPPAYLDVKEEDLLAAIDYLLLVLQDARSIAMEAAAATSSNHKASALLGGGEDGDGVSSSHLAEVEEEEAEDGINTNSVSDSSSGKNGVVAWSGYREYLRTIQASYHQHGGGDNEDGESSSSPSNSCFNHTDTFGLCPIDWGGCKQASSILNATSTSGPLVCLPDLANEEINSFVFQVNGENGRVPQNYTASRPPSPCVSSCYGGEAAATATAAAPSDCCDRSSWYVEGQFTTLSAIKALELFFGFGLKEHGSDGALIDSPSCPAEVASIYATKLKEITRILRNEGSHSNDEGKDIAAAEAAARDAANAADRLAKIKEKQKLLAERMRKKQAKASIALGMDGDVSATKKATSNTEEGKGSDTAATATAIVPRAANLHEGVVMHGASLECCFCKAGDEDGEALMYLTHAATSSHMTSIVHGPERDLATGEILCEGEDELPQRLNVTVMMCGHAAHATCFSKHFAFLQSQRGRSVRELLISRRGYRGMQFLGGAEIVCPLCSRVCSALACIPHLAPEVTAPPTTTTTAASKPPLLTIKTSLLAALAKVTKSHIKAHSNDDTTNSNSGPMVMDGYLAEWISSNLPVPSFKAGLEAILSKPLDADDEKGGGVPVPNTSTTTTPISDAFTSACQDARGRASHVIGPIHNLCHDTLSGFSLSADHRPLREHSFDTIEKAIRTILEQQQRLKKGGEGSPTSSSSISSGAAVAQGLLDAGWVLADGLRTVTEGLLKVGGGKVSSDSSTSTSAAPMLDTDRIMQPATKSFLSILAGAKDGADFQNRHFSALLSILVSLPCGIVGDLLTTEGAVVDTTLHADLQAASSALAQLFAPSSNATTSSSSSSSFPLGDKRLREDEDTTSADNATAATLDALRSSIGSSFRSLDAVELASLSTVLAIVEGLVNGVCAEVRALRECGAALEGAIRNEGNNNNKVHTLSQADKTSLIESINYELKVMLKGITPRHIERALAPLFTSTDTSTSSSKVSGLISTIGKEVVGSSSTASGRWSTATPLAILKVCVTGVPIVVAPLTSSAAASTAATLSLNNPLVLPLTAGEGGDEKGGNNNDSGELASKADALLSYIGAEPTTATTVTNSPPSTSSVVDLFLRALLPTADAPVTTSPSSMAPVASFHRFVPAHLGENSVEDVLSLRRRDYVFLPASYTAYSQLTAELKSTCSICDTTKIKSGLLCLGCKKLMCLRGSPPELLAHYMDFDKEESLPPTTAPSHVSDNESDNDADESSSSDTESVGNDADDGDDGPTTTTTGAATSATTTTSSAATAKKKYTRPHGQCACNGGGVGICILPKISSICLIQGNQERVAQLPPLYVDRFGEIDEGMRRGAPLSLSERFYVGDFMIPYIMNTWDHESSYLQHAWKHNMNTL